MEAQGPNDGGSRGIHGMRCVGISLLCHRCFERSLAIRMHFVTGSLMYLAVSSPKDASSASYNWKAVRSYESCPLRATLSPTLFSFSVKLQVTTIVNKFLFWLT